MFLKNIPKTAHCFWYGRSGLPFLRYISIASFAINNPAFHLKIYTTNVSLNVGNVFNSHEQATVHETRDYFHDLSNIPNVQIIYINSLDFIDYDVSSAVHWSDVLRIYLLATEGGFWIDSDIVFTRNLESSYLHLKVLNDTRLIICNTSLGSICPYTSHRIGFLASEPNSKFFNRLLDSVRGFNKVSNTYQKFGADLYNSLFPTIKSLADDYMCAEIHNLPNFALYSVLLTEMHSKRLNFEDFLSTPYIIGCHWYGGGDHIDALVTALNSSKNPSCTLKDLMKVDNSFILNMFNYSNSLVLEY